MSPLPRKSTLTRSKKTTIKKKTPVTRAKRGERLLVTCAPLLPDYAVISVAESLHGSFFTDQGGHYLQVVAVRVDGHKIFGKCQQMYEAAPYMFLPASGGKINHDV